ncbi:MAG: DUF3347 domain-containing protein [Halobacteriovoraceae bacterium]|nr:DUF3347 domain-containing protein [Halobacteriovoraceae bacterium]
MKRQLTSFKLFLLLIISTVALASMASGKHEHHHEMDHSNHKMKNNKVLSNVSKAELDSMKAYEELHKAYYSYNNKKIVELSKGLIDKLNDIKDKDIQTKLSESKVVKYLSAIKVRDNRSANNSLFNLVSKGIYESLIMGTELSKKYKQYYCPMVKKNWVQNIQLVSQVQNPYAPEMPHCGTQK